jgi:hypothetical protein
MKLSDFYIPKLQYRLKYRTYRLIRRSIIFTLIRYPGLGLHKAPYYLTCELTCVPSQLTVLSSRFQRDKNTFSLLNNKIISSLLANQPI